jgi:hypothetical protein
MIIGDLHLLPSSPNDFIGDPGGFHIFSGFPLEPAPA